MRHCFSYYEMTSEAMDKFNRAFVSKAPAKYNYKEADMNWSLIKATATSYRWTLESALLKDGQLPEKV